MLYSRRRTAVACLCVLLLLSGCRSVPQTPNAPAPASAQEVSFFLPVPDVVPAPEPENTTLYVLMYHHIVEDGEYCNDWMVTAGRLRQDLQWLADNGYTSLLPSELTEYGPLPDKAVLITFDDGYVSNYHILLPLLQEFQAKAAVALIVKRIEDGRPDFLSWEMCREMADTGLVEFGSHTYDLHAEDPRGVSRTAGESRGHYEARVFPDLQKSIDLMRENLGREVSFFAYPHGQTEAWAGSFLREHFPVTVTTQHGRADISGGLYEMPRHNINMDNSLSDYLP